MDGERLKKLTRVTGKAIRRSTLVQGTVFTLLAISTLSTLTILFWATDLSYPLYAAMSVVFAVCATSPYIYLGRLILTKAPTTLRQAFVGVITLAISVYGLSTYADALVLDPHPDPQEGFLFVLIPLYQWGACFAASVILEWAWHRQSRSHHAGAH
jgi:hypothetical protein